MALATFAVAALYYRLSPPRYRIQAKILSQRPSGGMSGGGGVGDDQGARSAWDLVHRRDNLVALIQQARLLEDGAVPLGRGLLVWFLEVLRPPEVAKTDDPIDVLVRVLDKRLTVAAEGDTIEFRLDWPDPQRGYQVVQGAVQNFLEARHVQEVGALDDVIAGMEGRTARLKADLDAALAASASQRRPAPAQRPAPRPRQASEELVRLRSLVEAKARAARDIEEFRSRRVAELESQLTQARATLSELHPTVVGLQRDLEALGHDSPQLRALREEERKVRADYAARLASEGIGVDTAGAPEPAAPPEAWGPREEDPRVRDLRLQYEQVIARVMSARVELDAARAGFKYRYNVVWPPQVPTELYSPKPGIVLGGGLLAALVLGLLAAVLPELLSGRINQRWQIERELGVTVLGEVPLGPRTRR